MFGYVKPVPSELLVKEYEFYKATYCGVCRAMKRHTGFFSNATLTYDSVLLALVRMLFVDDSMLSAKRGRCIAHPFKKRGMLIENEALVYTARVFAILSYYKMRDDISDEGLLKRLLILPARPVLKRGKKRADKANLTELSEIIKSRLEKISELEKNKCESPDMVATPFGELLGEIFSHGIEGNDKIVLYQFGFHLGKFIYCADAAEDYSRDMKEGKYNPYLLMYGGEPLTDENRMTIRCALILECKQLEGAINLMPFGNRATIENIVRNIVYLGLVERISFLGKENEK